MNERAIFEGALDRKDPEQRAAYLNEVCGADQALRQHIDGLLRAHEMLGSFLAPPAPAAGVTLDETIAERPGRVIGPYKLLQQIGEGGMGTVFLAEQTQPVQRKVALKLIKAGMDNHQVIARFEAERQALALMDHPNIAKVLDAGATDSGQPYFVMELVKGVPITKYCDEHRLSCKARLELFVSVCQAVQHAHQKGIIHRDLKPSNVLVAPYDARPVVKVIDFGVAKGAGQRLTDKTLFTEFGAVIGTLEYMSPEQAEINNQDIDTRSDIYSLGVLLYELLTGTTPLQRQRLKAAALLEVLRLIREEEPPRPSTRLSTTEELPSIAANRGLEPKKLTGLVRGELDWIVMKALEKDRSRRYETANAFAADLERYLHDEPVQACPPSAWYRFRKFARRNKAALTIAAVVVAALLLGIIGLAIDNVRVQAEERQKQQALGEKLQAEAGRADEQQKRADAESERASEQGKRADAEKKKADALEGWRQTAHYRTLALAFNEYRTNNVARAHEMLDKADPDLRHWEWHYLKRLSHSELSRVPIGSPKGFRMVALSLDGKRVVCHDARGGVILPEGPTNLLTQSLGGQALAPAGAPLGPLAQLAVAFRAAPFNAPAQVMRLYDTATGKEEISFLARNHYPLSMAFSPDGKWLGTCGNDPPIKMSVRVWNAFTGEEAAVLKGPDRWDIFQPPPAGVMAGLRFLLMQSRIAGQTLAPAGGGLALGPQLVFDFHQVARLDVLSMWPRELGGVAFSPDGQLVAATDKRGRLQVWERAMGKSLFRRAAHPMLNKGSNEFWDTKPVFSPDGKLVATACSEDGTVKLWDARTGDFVQSLWQGPLDKDEGFSRAVFSPKGKWIAAAGRYENVRFPDPSVRVWDVASNQPRYVFRAGKPFTCLAFSPDERLLAAGSLDDTLTLWDLDTGQEVASYRGHERVVGAVAFRDNGRVVSLDGHRTIRTWDATRGPEYRTFQTWAARHAAVSADGRRVAAAASQFDPTNPTNKGFHTFVWDAETAQVLMKYEAEFESPLMVAFSPDAQLVASAIAVGAGEGVVRVFDAGTGKLVRNLPDQSPKALGPAHLIAQGFAAQALAPAAGPWGALIQNLAAIPALKLEAFNVRAAPCDVVAWSPDGRLIASGGQDRVVRLWNAATGAPVRTLGVHARTVSALAFSRDGSRLASASGGITREYPATEPNPLKLLSDRRTDVPDLKVWEVATGKELHSFSFPGKGPGMALSPDGETLAVTFGDTGYAIRQEFFFPSGEAKVMVYTRAAPRGDVVRLFRVDTGKEVAVLKGHTRPPWCVAFSPDGKRVVTGGGADETIRLWDARTGEEIMTVGRHPGTVTSVSFSPDGHKIVSTSDNRDVRVWDATPLKK